MSINQWNVLSCDGSCIRAEIQGLVGMPVSPIWHTICTIDHTSPKAHPNFIIFVWMLCVVRAISFMYRKESEGDHTRLWLQICSDKSQSHCGRSHPLPSTRELWYLWDIIPIKFEVNEDIAKSTFTTAVLRCILWENRDLCYTMCHTWTIFTSYIAITTNSISRCIVDAPFTISICMI